MLENIPEIVKHEVNFLIEEMDFEIIDFAKSGHFNNFYVILRSDDFYIKIVSDRSQEFVDISFDNNHEWHKKNWIPLGYIRKLLYQDTPLKKCHIYSNYK